MSDVLPVRAPLRAWLGLMGLVLVWGGAFLMVKHAVAVLPSPFVAFARIALAAMAVAAAAFAFGKGLPKTREQWGWSAVIGCFSLALPFSILAVAQRHIPSGVAGAYMAATPLLTLPLAHLINRETVTRAKIIGLIIGFFGVLCILGPEALSEIGSAHVGAQFLCLAAACSYAVGSVSIRRAPKVDPVGGAAAALIWGSLFTLPGALTHWPEAMPGGETLRLLAWLGVVATGLAMILRIYVISAAGSVFMATAGYLTPISALVIGAAFGGEVIAPLDAMGVGLALTGVAISQRTLKG